jgi:hypothetical protein
MNRRGSRTLASAIATALICLPPVAVGQVSAPADAELRTAYCIPVMQWTVRALGDAVAASDSYWQQNPPTPDLQERVAKSRADLHQSLAAAASTLSRLQSYLSPRIGRLEPAALEAAERRGEADLRDLRALSDRCVKECGRDAPTAVNDPTATACFEGCNDKELATRIAACNAPTWLPP